MATGEDGRLLAAAIKKGGVASVCDSEPDDIGSVDNLMAVLGFLRGSGYQASLATPLLLQRHGALMACCRWLYQLATLSDASCRMVCAALEACPVPAAPGQSASTYLELILFHGTTLDKPLLLSLHNLFLTCMADQTFKRALAVAYARAYPKLALDYGRCVGLHEMSFFSLRCVPRRFF